MTTGCMDGQVQASNTDEAGIGVTGETVGISPSNRSNRKVGGDINIYADTCLACYGGKFVVGNVRHGQNGHWKHY
ncbi:MAG: hypothetical protein BWX99_01912 [Deltaproteobacteria bacterium ADurb.Bin151]|nr:MAG: hypothetical protein BWX99_01912 [Deltaproteobacteria bacterium ADurb.Bin151]